MFQKEIDLIKNNIDQIILHGNIGTALPLQCKIIGYRIKFNPIKKTDELMLLVCKSKSNGVNFPIDTYDKYTILSETIQGVDPVHYLVVAYDVLKIQKGKIIGAFLPDNKQIKF